MSSNKDFKLACDQEEALMNLALTAVKEQEAIVNRLAFLHLDDDDTDLQLDRENLTNFELPVHTEACAL
jgi:hypothetical protein